ncbi:alcohol dehydrogenase [Candidatus Pacearchaeota archaeon]|nr:alcohol dehydrogenase [Candidatus Pacearchaeota archaeon]|tara:strand:- start:7556 stop:8254 length:699 start_codon:yes stop_codon:yes gene_type:complete
MNILITGVSFGLGRSLKDEYLKLGHNVYGLSRTRVTDCNHILLDLNMLSFEHYGRRLTNLLNGETNFDLVILNAGILGKIKTFDNFSMTELDKIMNINVFSNKLILDNLFQMGVNVKQVVCMSSGASEKTYKGWGGYSISKAALRMMMQVYSKDVPQTHFMSVAPGLVGTGMQDYLCSEVDVNDFPETKKFIESSTNGTTRQPADVAVDIIRLVSDLPKMESGGYIDLRDSK